MVRNIVVGMDMHLISVQRWGRGKFGCREGFCWGRNIVVGMGMHLNIVQRWGRGRFGGREGFCWDIRDWVIFTILVSCKCRITAAATLLCGRNRNMIKCLLGSRGRDTVPC